MNQPAPGRSWQAHCCQGVQAIRKAPDERHLEGAKANHKKGTRRRAYCVCKPLGRHQKGDAKMSTMHGDAFYNKTFVPDTWNYGDN
eukprot:scaffold21658_cov22-Tisochrysis_lutea.AAC.3